MAQLYHQREDLAKAVWAYENIIRLNPDDSMALNNLAWILATSDDPEWRDYSRAMDLAKRAVEVEASPTFLDTLAEAYYVNGLYDRALDTIKQALDKATENRDYLLRQQEKFREALEKSRTGEGANSGAGETENRRGGE
jgi:cytochrome c-type biogenesis protein CcmH/NrfG